MEAGDCPAVHISKGAVMKIYGDYTFILDKLNIRNNSQVEVFQNGTKVVEFADKFLEEQRASAPDRVSISPEGMGYVRDKNSFSVDEDFVRISDDGLSLMDGVCRGYILQRLDLDGTDGVSSKAYGEMEKRFLEALAGKEEKNVKSYAESLAYAYGAMYKNIVDGYDNGTREVWTLDTSTGDDFNGVEFMIGGNAVRYRKLTKEEELGRLRETLGRLTEDVARQLVENEAAAPGRTEDISLDRIPRHHPYIQYNVLWEEGKVEEKEVGQWETWAQDAQGEGGELREAGKVQAEEDFWKTALVVKELLKELDKLITEIEAMFAKKEPEPENIAERIVSEARNHGAATVARGKQQAQFANYRKMSQMATDVQSILGNIRA